MRACRLMRIPVAVCTFTSALFKPSSRIGLGVIVVVELRCMLFIPNTLIVEPFIRRPSRLGSSKLILSILDYVNFIHGVY